jgi:sulfopyruvate decarboxylase TPP-binding subunit
MRGEWAEFNPWQVPMSQATQKSLNAVGVRTMRANSTDEIADVVGAAAVEAYEADQQIAVLMSQRLIGAKKW